MAIHPRQMCKERQQAQIGEQQASTLENAEAATPNPVREIDHTWYSRE